MDQDAQDTLHGSIPRLEFESAKGVKGWADFRDIDDLSGADVRRLRKGIGSSDNAGEATNAFLGEALSMLVTAWDVPGKPDLPIPRQDPKNLDRISGAFLVALEQHVQPFLDFLKPKKAAVDDGEPGSPPRPARD